MRFTLNLTMKLIGIKQGIHVLRFVDYSLLFFEIIILFFFCFFFWVGWSKLINNIIIWSRVRAWKMKKKIMVGVFPLLMSLKQRIQISQTPKQLLSIEWVESTIQFTKYGRSKYTFIYIHSIVYGVYLLCIYV